MVRGLTNGLIGQKGGSMKELYEIFLNKVVFKLMRLGKIYLSATLEICKQHKKYIAGVAFITIVTSAISLSFSDHGGENDDDITPNIHAPAWTNEKDYFNVTLEGNFFNIIAIEEDIIIEDIVLNKGNCYIMTVEKKPFPRTLKYGNSYRKVYSCQNLLQIDIFTDKGGYSYKF